MSKTTITLGAVYCEFLLSVQKTPGSEYHSDAPDLKFAKSAILIFFFPCD